MEQPKIPTLKDSQKPQVKIKGIQAGLTLIDRLKQFKKKDLAFILAGLGTLFMAPLAEHFMMSPESGDATLQQGWGGGKGGGNNLFGSGSSPYEPGTSGTAPGGPTGGGSDVITPLNVRDPSALVMGPGATQQPPTNSAAPSVTPPSTGRSEPDLKDALAGAAARAASAAVKKAPMPIPKIALGGSGLRGLGVAGGGSSAGAGLGAISSNGLASGRADTGGGLGNVRSAPGYRGVGTRGPNNANGGALEALKAAAGKAGEAMNRGSATSGLAEAAAQQMPTGGAGFSGAGAGAFGKDDKGMGGNAGKDSKSVGESLDFLNKKSRMEKELELEFEKRKKQEMFWPDLMRDAQKELFMKGLIAPATESLGCVFKKGSIQACFKPSSDPGTWLCKEVAGVPEGLASVSGDKKCEFKEGKPSNAPCIMGNAYVNEMGQSSGKCTLQGGDGSAKTDTGGLTEGGPSTPPDGIAAGWPATDDLKAMNSLDAFCREMNKRYDELAPLLGRSTPLSEQEKREKSDIDKMRVEVKKLAAARDALYRGKTDECKHDRMAGFDGFFPNTAKEQYGKVHMSLGNPSTGAIDRMTPLIGERSADNVDRVAEKAKDAREALTKAEDLRKKVAEKLKSEPFSAAPFDGSYYAGLVENTVFKTHMDNAKKANDALGRLVADQEKLTKTYEPLVAGSENSSKPKEGMLAVVIDFNKRTEDMLQRAAVEPYKIKVDPPSDKQPAPAAYEPGSEGKVVLAVRGSEVPEGQQGPSLPGGDKALKAATAALDAVDAADKKVKQAEATPDAADDALAKQEFEAAMKTAREAVKAGSDSRGSIQTQERSVIQNLRKSVDDVKSGTGTGTGTVTGTGTTSAGGGS